MSALSGMFSLLTKFGALLSRGERRRGLVLVPLMVLGMALETVCTGLVMPVVALMTQADFTRINPQLGLALQRLDDVGRTEVIVGSVLALVCIYAVKNVFLGYVAWRQARFAYGVQAQVSQRLFSAYLQRPYSFHLYRNSAQLIRNITKEVAMFTDAMLGGLTVTTEMLVLAGISTLLIAIEPLGTLVAVGLLGSAAWAFYRFARHRLVQWGQRRQNHDGWRLQHLQQGLGAVKEVQLLGREAEFLRQYRQHDLGSAELGARQTTLQQLPRLALELLAIFGLAMLVVALVARGSNPAAIAPTVALFAAAAFRLMPSVNRMLTALQTVRYCLPSINVLYEETRSAETGKESTSAPTRPLAFGSELRFVNVGFSYPGSSTPALKRINVRIGKSECVGFVGASGAGKSTVVDLLLGLLKPGSGVVTVDGTDIQANLRGWQGQIGYVPQSIYLTDDSLRRNVAFGLAEGEINDAAVARAIGAAQLEDLLATLPNGMNTSVGERGVRLSGGQRQRIGVARALYHDPAVLVLDEATSALDTATERAIMQTVRALRGRKTIVIVAHRLSTVEHCERLYQLQAGMIVAEGTPAELLRLPHAV